jgi:cell division protein FtsI/penicillin-binding protein 2
MEHDPSEAPSAGELAFAPDCEAEAGCAPDPYREPDGPRIVKVIGYTPGSPLDKELLAGFLGQERLDRLETGYIELREPNSGEALFIKTTFDKTLQAEAEKWVRGAGGFDAALVVMDPLTGKILAMAGAGARSKLNPAVAGSFPAASVFKIVTAAAAIELNSYTRDNYVLFDGGRHTLFKSNVVKEPDSGRHKATLKEGFAHSINSVFGKLGIYNVGPDALKEKAELFRFNSPILFEMEVTPSSFTVEDREDSFHLAGLASGYNRTTKASPLHMAMLTASVYNDGKILEPYFAEEASDSRLNILYTGEPKLLGRAMGAETSLELRELMRGAVYDGTGRKRFHDAATHRILKDLDLGGKSGSINDTEGNPVDWFVAFSSIKGKTGADARPLAIAAVVVQGGRTRMSSQELVRRAVLSYYKPKPAAS